MREIDLCTGKKISKEERAKRKAMFDAKAKKALAYSPEHHPFIEHGISLYRSLERLRGYLTENDKTEMNRLQNIITNRSR